MAAVITSLYRAYCYARLLEMRKNRRRLVRPTRFRLAGIRSLEPEITNAGGMQSGCYAIPSRF
jgi:hypothetical protein